MKNLSRKYLIFFNIVIFIYLSGGIFAPIARFLGLNQIADYLYFVYGFLCHQKAERSIHLFDYQMAFCARDFAIFISAQIIGILSFFNAFQTKPIKFIEFVILSVPMAIDGTVQLISEILNVFNINNAQYESTGLIRFVTGSLFGIALGLFIFPTLSKEFREQGCEKLNKKSKIMVIIFAISLVLYLLSVQIWILTSRKYKPTNFLDSKVAEFEKGRKLHIR